MAKYFAGQAASLEGEIGNDSGQFQFIRHIIHSSDERCYVFEVGW